MHASLWLCTAVCHCLQCTLLLLLLLSAHYLRAVIQNRVHAALSLALIAVAPATNNTVYVQAQGMKRPAL
jgi:hypothetical protein